MKELLHHVYIPKSEELRKHILSFYVFNEHQSDAAYSYYTFPNRGVIIGFFEQADIRPDGPHVSIYKDPKAASTTILVGKMLGPRHVTYHQPIRKISVHFNDGGVNHFYPNYFTEFAPNNIQLQPTAALGLDESQIFQPNLAQCMDNLERYFLSRLQPADTAMVEKAAALIWERPSISNTELALALATSEKTLSRKFKKQAGCKLSDCKRIAMFKKSVEDYFGPTEKTLVELCYDNGLYDPSHFNKLFRDTTTFSPSTFFDRAKNMGDENQAYIFS